MWFVVGSKIFFKLTTIIEWFQYKAKLYNGLTEKQIQLYVDIGGGEVLE